jgi:hypothetical protein
MGREVRRVPADWEHPRDHAGHYRPLYGRSFAKEVAQWDIDAAMYRAGYERSYLVECCKVVRHDGTEIVKPAGLLAYKPATQRTDCSDYSDYAGGRPVRDDYMPDWSEAERTHWQMYESTSEGTPISPVCASPEELARWLADNKASAFADMTASYESWLATINAGSAPSAITTTREDGSVVMQSGVEALGAA